MVKIKIAHFTNQRQVKAYRHTPFWCFNMLDHDSKYRVTGQVEYQLLLT